jgi:hypothetical protein
LRGNGRPFEFRLSYLAQFCRSIGMSSVIKKRRRKISRHKYRKRLKRMRHKRK